MYFLILPINHMIYLWWSALKISSTIDLKIKVIDMDHYWHLLDACKNVYYLDDKIRFYWVMCWIRFFTWGSDLDICRANVLNVQKILLHFVPTALNLMFAGSGHYDGKKLKPSLINVTWEITIICSSSRCSVFTKTLKI